MITCSLGISLLLSGCLPKTTSSSSGSGSSGSSSSSSTNSSPYWTATPTPTYTYTYYPTATPTGTANNACGDALGDCSGQFPVINLPISNKRGANTAINEPINAYNSWNSTGLGFTTDGRLRLRVQANSQPPRSNCSVSGSYRAPAYSKLKARVVVKLSSGAEIFSQVVGPINVGERSSIIDVPVGSFPSAYPYIVQVDTVTTDTTCMWYGGANSYSCQGYSGNFCGCPVEAPDPTNCWSVNLHVVTSSTNNFAP